MKKIFLLLLLLSSFLTADIIHNVSLLDTKNKCIYNDYYNKGGKFYYRYLTSPDTQRSTTSKKYTSFIIPGYQYDTEEETCTPENWLILGMDVKDWHFLEALTGLLFGFTFMVFTIILFMQVGKER